MERKSILVVDDDRAILDSFRKLLETKGYYVDTAQSGKEAIEAVCRGFYNLDLIDIKLPDMAGTSLLREIHLIDPKMKKVMVTGYSSRENAIDSLNSGADGYMEKPVMPVKLLEVVGSKLSEQELENKLYEDTINNLLRPRMTDEHLRD